MISAKSMRGDRLSVAAPMAIVVVVSVELAALNWGSGVAVDIARLLSVLLLATGTYLARYRTGEEGAWWFGFSLFGWAYYVLVLNAMGPWLSFSDQSIVSFLPAAILDYWTSGLPPMKRFDRYSERLRILHEIFIMIVAVAGGIICWVAARRRRAPRVSAEGTQEPL